MTDKEYEILFNAFRSKLDSNKIDYVAFNEGMEKIFTDKTLEKDPLKKLTSFNAPSILDPKDVLNDQEERDLHEFLTMIGTVVRHKRLMIKPYFQDKVS